MPQLNPTRHIACTRAQDNIVHVIDTVLLPFNTSSGGEMGMHQNTTTPVDTPPVPPAEPPALTP
jgi:hypothetical protein